MDGYIFRCNLGGTAERWNSGAEQPTGRHRCRSRPFHCHPLIRSTHMASIKVPPLGESIVEATIARWLKKEGDVVAQNESLVELETDKITVEVPAFKAGLLTKQAKKEGDVVHVGEEIGEIDEHASVGAV